MQNSLHCKDQAIYFGAVLCIMISVGMLFAVRMRRHRSIGWRECDAIRCDREWSAQVVEVAVAGEALTVKRIVCGIDCGTAVHPDGIRAQGESSIIMALTAAMMGEMNLENGRIVEGNYDTYPMLLLHQTPPMEILIVESPEARVGGVGEPMTPPLAPALANAIFAATGKRIRSLPLSKQGYSLA